MGKSRRVGCSLPRECRLEGWDKEARGRKVRRHHLCSRNSGVGRATSKPCSQRPLHILPLPLYLHDLARDLPSGSPSFLFSHKDVCLCSVTGTEEALGGFSSWPPSLGSSVFLSQNSFQFTGTPPLASTRRHHARH